MDGISRHSSLYAGDKVISQNGIFSDANYCLSERLKELHFDIDLSIDRREAVDEVLRFMDTDQYVTRILLVNTFVGLIRSIFIDAQVPPQYLIYLVGPSQYGKTTLACRTSSLYNRTTDQQRALTNLVSTTAALQKNIAMFRDTTYIIDDLCCDSNATSKRQREGRLKDLIRIIGNNKEKEKQTGKETYGYSPNCTVVCTAEYLLDDAFSTLGRCVVVHLDPPVNKKQTNSACKNPLVVPTAAYHFICWCSAHYKEIVADIRRSHDSYQELLFSVESHYMRLYDARFILETGMSQFLDFCQEVGSVTKEQVPQLKKKFSDALDEVLERQKQELGSLNESFNYVAAVAALFKHKKIVLTEEGQYIPGRSDGVKRDNSICLDGERLTALLCEAIGKKRISVQAVCEQFLLEGLLLTDNSASNTKKVYNKRMLVIRKQAFCNYIRAES